MDQWNGQEWLIMLEKWVLLQMMMILTDMAMLLSIHNLLIDNGTTNSAQCLVGSKLQTQYTQRDHSFSTMTIS